MKTQLTVIEKEISPIAVSAISLEIVDDTTLKTGVELLSKLNQYNDRITEEKEKVTKPLNEALKAERGRWKPLEKVYEDAIASIRLKMTSYQTLLVQTRKAEEERIASRVGSGKGFLKPETAVNKLSNLAVVEKEHATEAGLVQFRETPTLKVTDITKIASEYFDLNEARLLKDLKTGKLIPGAEIEIIQTPVNYR